MSTDANQPASTDADQPPMRAVAQNPRAFAVHLASVQRVLLAIGRDLESLQEEVRVEQRNTHVPGDRWFHARKRAWPTEKALKDALKHLESVTEGLEKAGYKRRAHDDEVKALPGKRKEKELAKSQKKGRPVLPAATATQDAVLNTGNPVYAEPASIYDLGKRRSA